MALAGQEAFFFDWVGIDLSLKEDGVCLYLIFWCSGRKVQIQKKLITCIWDRRGFRMDMGTYGKSVINTL